MSLRLMTCISLPGVSNWIGGFADWDLVPAEKMIADHRARALAMKQDAEAILAAADEDFRIETYRGVHVQRDLQVIQEGRAKQ